MVLQMCCQKQLFSVLEGRGRKALPTPMWGVALLSDRLAKIEERNGDYAAGRNLEEVELPCRWHGKPLNFAVVWTTPYSSRHFFI